MENHHLRLFHLRVLDIYYVYASPASSAPSASSACFGPTPDYVRDLKSFFCVKLSHYRFPAIGLKRKVLCYLQAFILYTRETQHNGSGKVWPKIALRNPRESESRELSKNRNSLPAFQLSPFFLRPFT